jgi:putative phosphoesterase
MKIALISDSHGSKDRLDQFFTNAQQANIRHIIHAGDFAVYDVDKIFAKYPDIQFYIARGNCDVNDEIISLIKNLPHCHLQEVLYFEISEVKFGASHIEGVAQSVLKDKKIDVYCHGHTHRMKTQNRNNAFVLNPGSLQDSGTGLIIDLPSMQIKSCFYNDLN